VCIGLCTNQVTLGNARCNVTDNSGKFAHNFSQIYYQNIIQRGLDEILDVECRLLLSVY